MTIAVAIRTGSAMVFAADSKVTTSGVIGFEKNGTPRLVEQTYDNATKVVADRNGVFMGMVAGSANLGRTSITDFLSREAFPRTWPSMPGAQDERLFDLVRRMTEERNQYWSAAQVPENRWPSSTVLLAGSTPDGTQPLGWRLRLDGAEASCERVLESPGIRLEGSAREVFALLHGFEWEALWELRRTLRIKPERLAKGLRTSKVLRPLDKLNLTAMPTQDAIDLAVFLAEVQVQMDRFLPGTPACGGPIDVLVLQTAPVPAIRAFPGKVMGHPRRREETESSA